MKILIGIFHPAHVHNFKNVIFELKKRGHKVVVVAADKDRCFELMDKLGISYVSIAKTTGKNILEKALLFLLTTWRIFRLGKKYKVNVLLDRALPMTAIASFLLRKKHIIFDDTEITTFAWKINKLLSYKIITPVSFMTDLGPKQIRLQTYKELFYLHPNYFQPDSSVLPMMGLKDGDKYVIMRFVSWDASHDFGHDGITNDEKMKLIQEASKYAKVFISSEKKLPVEFDPFLLKTPVDKIHSVLYYATLFIGDGGTMTSEAAVLGTHAISLCEMEFGSHKEQENRYQLVVTLTDRKTRFERAKELINKMLSMPELEKDGLMKKERLIAEQKDCVAWIVDFIERKECVLALN